MFKLSRKAIIGGGSGGGALPAMGCGVGGAADAAAAGSVSDECCEEAKLIVGKLSRMAT